jgi:hypothetical protein
LNVPKISKNILKRFERLGVLLRGHRMKGARPMSQMNAVNAVLFRWSALGAVSILALRMLGITVAQDQCTSPQSLLQVKAAPYADPRPTPANETTFPFPTSAPLAQISSPNQGDFLIDWLP